MPTHVHLLLSEPQPNNTTGAPLKPGFGLSGIDTDGAPLKPGFGLSGIDTDGAPLKPAFGLSGPDTDGAPLKHAFGLSGPDTDGAPLKPAFGLSGPADWLTNPHHYTLADALKSLKQGVSRHLIGNLPLKPKPGLSGAPDHFWLKRYYDFNIRNYHQFVEKLRYIHRNPVKAGLCEHPEDWPWSSFRHYATGTDGRVEIESEWTGRKRERAAGTLCPAIELPHSSQNRA